MEKSTQCEFCSLADFGSKSAENKAVSVLLLSPDLGFVPRFEKVTPERVTSCENAEARSSGCLSNNTCEQTEQEDNRAELGRGQKAPTGDCKETLETRQLGIWSSKHQVVGGRHARPHALLPRSLNRYLIKLISLGAAVNIRRKK